MNVYAYLTLILNLLTIMSQKYTESMAGTDLGSIPGNGIYFKKKV